MQWNFYKADAIAVWKKCPLYGDVRIIEINKELVYVTVFQVDPFRGMKKVHIKQNSNVSFSFKRDTKETTNVVSKIKSNLIL